MKKQWNSPNDLSDKVDNDAMFPHVKDLPWTILKIIISGLLFKWLFKEK